MARNWRLTLHGNGRTKAAGAEFEVTSHRCVLPLCPYFLMGMHPNHPLLRTIARNLLTKASTDEQGKASTLQFFSWHDRLCIDNWSLNSTFFEQNCIECVPPEQNHTIFHRILIGSTDPDSEPNQSAFNGRFARS
jgi:hypothetical protein